MKRNYGNQYESRKRYLFDLLDTARDWLVAGNAREARACLNEYRQSYREAPDSTKRRWRCGQ